jgi:hypothetical protein
MYHESEEKICPYLEGRALRKCPVDIFSDEPACRESPNDVWNIGRSQQRP